LTFAAVATAFAASAPDAWAADDADALIQHGIELRKKGQDDAALTEFRRAYGLARTPRAAAQLGFAEQATGDWAAAEGHVQEALAAASDLWIVKNRATIEGSLRTIEQHTARIDVLGGVSGAEVEVNGRPTGKLPLGESVRVNAGAVNVVVRASGYRTVVRTVTVAPGERTKVHFVLETTGANVPGGAEVAAKTDPTRGIQPPEPVVLDGHQRLRQVGIGVGITGVALLGAGIASMMVANGRLDRLEADAAARRPYNETNGNWQSFQTASIVLYATGGAALIGGAAAYFFGRPSSSGQTRTEVSFFVAPAPRGLALGGTF
jgi:tetratricopeptide (TPR) repeat protein